MPNRLRIVAISDADWGEAGAAAGAGSGHPGPSGRAGEDRAAGGRGANLASDRAAGRVHRADGDQVAAAVRRGAWPGLEDASRPGGPKMVLRLLSPLHRPRGSVLPRPGARALLDG
jgi:hypothetical protein